MHTALIVYCEWPENSRLKYSFSKNVSEKKAEALYKAFLLDLAEKHSDQEYELYFAFEEKSLEEKFKKLLPGKNLYPMKGNTLGERLYNIFKDFSISYQKIIVADSDLPNISSYLINEGITLMKEKDVILGPTNQGGYYLIGLNKPQKLFSGINFYHETVLKKTISLIEEKQLSYALLKKIKAISVFKDLQELFEKKELIDCPNTLKELENIQEIKIRS